jgi:NAD(P)H-nitrite reductase large subunit
LNVMLDETASALEEEALRRAGIRIITSRTVAEISSYTGDAVTGVTLDDGTPIPCELVVVAIGVRPHVELIAGTGVEINRGIVVDHQMVTSHPGVYACGDVAEAYDVTYGECRLTPIWPNAYLGGRVAGFNMAGKKMAYPGGVAMNSLKYLGLDVVSAGIVNPPDDSYEILSQSHDSTYHKVILKDGLVVGLVFAGNIEKSGIIFNLIRNKIKVDGFQESLVAEDFGLSALPRELWQPHLEVPPPAAISPVEAEPVGELVSGE